MAANPLGLGEPAVLALPLGPADGLALAEPDGPALAEPDGLAPVEREPLGLGSVDVLVLPLGNALPDGPQAGAAATPAAWANAMAPASRTSAVTLAVPKIFVREKDIPETPRVDPGSPVPRSPHKG